MNRRSFVLGFCAMGVAGCATKSRASQASLPIAGTLDETIARVMGRIQVPGLAVAVYSRDGLFSRGYGITDVTTGERVDADTLFYIASCTKAMTALALASLLAELGIELDVTLSAFAPEAPLPASVRPEEVRLRDLLSHTSGIRNHPIGFRLAYTGQHHEELLWHLLSLSEVNEEAPLGRYGYTNHGYNIATILAFRRLGVRWQDMLEKIVFRPCGMRRASASMLRGMQRNASMARPHALLPDGLRRLYLEKTDRTMQSAGGVVMSASDALRWLELNIEDGAIDGRRLFPAALVQSTRVPQVETTGDWSGFGYDAYTLGWFRGLYNDEPILHHTGGFSGMNSHVSYMPARHIGVATFANEYNGARLTDAIAGYVYDLATGRSDASARLEAHLEAIAGRRRQFFDRIAADRERRAGRASTLSRPLAAHAGIYENESYGRIEVTVDGARLNVAFGVLHSVAEPATERDAVRVEFFPFEGERIAFVGEGSIPGSLRYNDEIYVRL